MSINYEIVNNLSGILDGSKYTIEDTERNFEEWRKLQTDFSKKFSEFSSKQLVDYEFPEWHHGVKCLYVYLYNERFYTKDFIPKILDILQKNGNCMAEFECFNDVQELIGLFQVYKNKVLFDEISARKGLIDRLWDSETSV